MNQILEALKRHPMPRLDLRERGPFVANLLFAHALMVASENLIADVLKRDMPAALRAFYEEHLEEERGHAAWLEEDLSSLGALPTLDWRAAQIAGTQYYLVRHGPAQALLGYMAALECRPMAYAGIEELEAIHGKEALRTLRYHSTHDIGHGLELLRIIAQSEAQAEILHNVELTASMLAWALADCGNEQVDKGAVCLM